MDTPLLLTSLVLSTVIGFFCSYIAIKKKGRSPSLWFWLGFLLGVGALIILYLLPPQKKRRSYRWSAGKIPTPVSSIPPVINKVEKPQSPPPSSYWFYLSPSKQQVGPVNFEGIKDALEKGEIHLKSFVWNDQLPEWKRLSELKEISDLMSTTKN